jgi:hypothetical protein
MGDIADMMLDGILCEGCGEYIGAPTGYPMRCSGCGGGHSSEPAAWKVDEGKKIEALIAKGFKIQKFTDFHFRINSKVDVWPSKGKYWVLGTQIKGKYYKLEDLLEKLKAKL